MAAVEPFTIKVRLVFDDRSIKELQKGLQNIVSGEGRPTTVARAAPRGGLLQGISELIRNIPIIGDLFGELADILKDVVGIVGVTVGGGGGGGTGVFAGVAGGGAEGGAGGAVAAIAVLVMIATVIKRIWDLLVSSSGILKAISRMFTTTFQMFIRPFADFLGLLLKPILVILLRYIAIPFYRSLLPMIKQVSQLFEAVISPILKEVAPIIVEILKYAAIPLLIAILAAVMLLVAPLMVIAFIIKSILAFVEWMRDTFIPALTGLGSAIVSGVQGALTALGNAVVGAVTWVYDSLVNIGKTISGFITTALGFITNFGRTVYESFLKGLGWLWEQLSTVFGSLGNIFGGVGNVLGGLARDIASFFGFGEWRAENIAKAVRLRVGAEEQKVEQRVWIYPRIEIGSVSSEIDIRELLKRIDEGIGDAVRRRGLLYR
ncbi:MAG: hypothetical protein ACUVUF_07805 [Candidatus Bathycorpusculaceae bacterium]